MIKDYAKKCEKGMLVSSVFICILGLIIAIAPTGSLRMITWLLAISLMIMGIAQLIFYIKLPREEKMTSFSLTIGIILLAVGIFLAINTESLVKFITLVIGITICVKALLKIQFAINIRDLSSKWKYNLVFGLISMTIGILLVLNPFASAALFLRIVGITLVIGTVAEIIETMIVIKSIDDATIDYKEVKFTEKK